MTVLQNTENNIDQAKTGEYMPNGALLYSKIFRCNNFMDAKMESEQQINLENLGCNRKTATSILAFFMYKKWIRLNNSYAKYYLICLIYGYSPAQFDLVFYQDRLDLRNGFCWLEKPIQLEKEKAAEYRHLLCVKGIPYKRYVYMITDLYDYLLSIKIAEQEAVVMFDNYRMICQQVLHPTLYAEVWGEQEVK